MVTKPVEEKWVKVSMVVVYSSWRVTSACKIGKLESICDFRWRVFSILVMMVLLSLQRRLWFADDCTGLLITSE